MRASFWLALSLLITLAACEAGTETASYKLPPTAGGRICSHQCVEAQDFCHQSCDLHQRQCVIDVQTQAMRDYDAYTRDQFQRHEAIDLRPSDFERQTKCKDTRAECVQDCDHTYQTCFSDCGGEVNITKSCQFLCF